jgi:predicted Zn-ribbon and HTH transcriptional regulator
MSRKQKRQVCKCEKLLENGSICGEPSYLRQVPTRNTQSGKNDYRLYWYWVHKNKQVKPKKHYKGPVDPLRAQTTDLLRRKRERKSEADRIRKRRFNYSSTPKYEYEQKDPKELKDIILPIFYNIEKEFKEVSKNHKKLARLLQMFPISEPQYVKKLQAENKLPYLYKWEPGVEEKAMKYLNKAKEMYDSFKRVSEITFHEYSNAMFDYDHNNKVSAKEKSQIFLDKLKTFLTRCMIIEGTLKLWNEILLYVTDERPGESLLGWLKIAEDKLVSGSTKGAALLTGEYIMRLGKQPVDKKGNIIKNACPRTVEIVPIKREFTSKQIESKIQDISDTLGIKDEFDLNYKIRCEGCGFEVDTEKINPKEIDNDTLIKIDMIDNQIRQKIRDQMDEKLLNFIRLRINNLEQDPLSQFVEIVFNNTITEIRKSAKQFYKEQIKGLYNKDVTEAEIANLKEIEVEPQTLDREKVDAMDLHKVVYCIKYGRADRRDRKSPYFSEQA